MKSETYADVTERVDLDGPTTITFPSRYIIHRNYGEAVNELGILARVIAEGTNAIVGVYMRLCDTIRQAELADPDVRRILEPYFSQPRISEILRVARAPQEVYWKYSAGFFGFKVALKHCRLYTITSTEELKVRQARRAADRLVRLLGVPSRIEVKSHVVTIV